MNKGTEQKILLVDDEKNVQMVLSDILKEAGYLVKVAKDAHEAIEKVIQGAFDLALIDLRMPGINGIKLMFLLKERNPQMPIIIYTGYASINTAIEALKNGADDYLIKPFSLKELKMSINKVLNKDRDFDSSG